MRAWHGYVICHFGIRPQRWETEAGQKLTTHSIKFVSLGNHGGIRYVSCAWRNHIPQTNAHCKGSAQTGNWECHFKEEQPLVAGDGDNYPHQERCASCGTTTSVGIRDAGIRMYVCVVEEITQWWFAT